MNRYTQGEWEARLLEIDGIVIKKEAWEIYTPEYDVVAYIPYSAPIRKEADARLIASAPDLLEACNQALIEFNYLKDYLTPIGKKTKKQLKQAIAKAEKGK